LAIDATVGEKIEIWGRGNHLSLATYNMGQVKEGRAPKTQPGKDRNDAKRL